MPIQNLLKFFETSSKEIWENV